MAYGSHRPGQLCGNLRYCSDYSGILKGIRCGILDDSYLPCAVKAIRGILDCIDSDGTVLEVSGGTGMGMDAEHYKNILIAPMAYGQSLTILALAEALNV